MMTVVVTVVLNNSRPRLHDGAGPGLLGEAPGGGRVPRALHRIYIDIYKYIYIYIYIILCLYIYI